MRELIRWKELQSSYGFRPTLWVLGLVLLAVALGAADRQLAAIEAWTGFTTVVIGGAVGARTMLSAIATASLTVAALAFSVIMLAVVQTANAYSPRLLDEYLGDTSNQHVLGILLGTFLFTLLALREVRSTTEIEYVPALMITVSFVLAALCVAAFVYFINHVAHSIEVSAIVRRIQHETESILAQHPLTVGEERATIAPPPRPSAPPALIQAPGDGYVAAIELDDLFQLAVEHDLTVQLLVGPGAFVVAGSPLIQVWPAEAADEVLQRQMQGLITLGDERLMVQDVLYGIQQLTDVALRAVSPGINDPSTAISCIDSLTVLLTQVVQRPAPSPYRWDERGALRLIVPQPDLAVMLDEAFNPIRQYTRTDTACILRLLDACRQIGYGASRPADRDALWEHVMRTVHSADRHLVDPWDRAALNRHLHLAAEVLERVPTLLPVAEPTPRDGSRPAP